MRIFNFTIKDFLYPPICPICGNPVEQRGLCNNCKSEIIIDFNYLHKREYLVFYMNHYVGVSRELWHVIKYKGFKYLLEDLGYKMGYALKSNMSLNHYDYIVPVPMHIFRYLERGFNQSLILANIISKIVNIPLDANIIKRKRITKKMALIENEKRKENIKNAFIVKKNIFNKNILVIDDIMTTGATFEEMRKTLVNAGANKVDLFVFSLVHYD